MCKVVYEQRWDNIRKRHVGAFSWTELDQQSVEEGSAYERARYIASEVYFKRNKPRVPGALFYHASYIEPSWARHKEKLAHIGQHIFYK